MLANGHFTVQHPFCIDASTDDSDERQISRVHHANVQRKIRILVHIPIVVRASDYSILVFGYLDLNVACFLCGAQSRAGGRGVAAGKESSKPTTITYSGLSTSYPRLRSVTYPTFWSRMPSSITVLIDGNPQILRVWYEPSSSSIRCNPNKAARG